MRCSSVKSAKRYDDQASDQGIVAPVQAHPRSVSSQMKLLREIQRETGGFTEFFEDPPSLEPNHEPSLLGPARWHEATAKRHRFSSPPRPVDS